MKVFLLVTLPLAGTFLGVPFLLAFLVARSEFVGNTPLAALPPFWCEPDLRAIRRFTSQPSLSRSPSSVFLFFFLSPAASLFFWPGRLRRRTKPSHSTIPACILFVTPLSIFSFLREGNRITHPLAQIDGFIAFFFCSPPSHFLHSLLLWRAYAAAADRPPIVTEHPTLSPLPPDTHFTPTLFFLLGWQHFFEHS